MSSIISRIDNIFFSIVVSKISIRVQKRFTGVIIDLPDPLVDPKYDITMNLAVSGIQGTIHNGGISLTALVDVGADGIASYQSNARGTLSARILGSVLNVKFTSLIVPLHIPFPWHDIQLGEIDFVNFVQIPDVRIPILPPSQTISLPALVGGRPLVVSIRNPRLAITTGLIEVIGDLVAS